MPKRILIIAAHPDDELLGAGATLRKHVESGDAVFALILGQGSLSRDDGSAAGVSALRRQAKAAGEIIGWEKIEFAEFPDNAFDTIGLLKITKEVERVFSDVKPDAVYTHHEYDLNVDHRMAFQAVLTAGRPCNEHAPCEIYTFETLSSTEWQSKDQKEFMPNVYVDVEKQIETKLKALKQYSSEMRPYPHARSLEGVAILAQYRGLESGMKYAEAFRLIRSLQK